MNYFTLLALTYQDGADAKKSIYTYDTLDEAVSRFHMSLGGYINGDNIATAMACVIDAKGSIKKSEYWEATVKETTTEDTTTEETTSTSE